MMTAMPALDQCNTAHGIPQLQALSRFLDVASAEVEGRSRYAYKVSCLMSEVVGSVRKAVFVCCGV